MFTESLESEQRTVRRVFATWSIAIPESFIETFALEDGYWHAFDEDRSISLTSIVVTDGDRLVSAAEIVHTLPELDGSPIKEAPPFIMGRAVIDASGGSASASGILQGVLAAEGRLLLVTITADDLDWARSVWLSIRSHPAEQTLLH